MTNDDIDRVLATVKKSVKGFVGRGDNPEACLKRVPFDIPVLDKILGGGLVRGRIHLFTGQYSTCKTYLTQKAISQVQKIGGRAAFIDAERRYDPEWFALTGVNIKDLILIRPNFGEEAIDAAITLVKEKIDIVVIDSFAGLLPIDEADEGMEQKFIGLQARMMNKAFKKLVPINNDTVIIATNQMRENIGNSYHPGINQSMPGGKGQFYFSSLILETRRRGWLTKNIKTGKTEEGGSKDSQKTGFIVECFMTKCNFAPPLQSCQIPFNFIEGTLDNVASVVELAIETGVIKQTGAWYAYKDQKLMGRQSVCDYFEENKDEFEEVKKEVL